MPVAKIHVLEGRYDETRLGKVSKAVQDALMSVLGVPPDDFFQIIHALPRSHFRHTPSFLGLKYSDDLILLEVTFISGRPKEKRLRASTGVQSHSVRHCRSGYCRCRHAVDLLSDAGPAAACAGRGGCHPLRHRGAGSMDA